MHHGRGRAATGLVVAFVAALVASLALGRTALDAWTALTSSPAPDPDDAVSLLAAAAGTALAGWLALSVLLCVLLSALFPGLAAAGQAGRLGASRAARLVAAATPRVMQRAVAAALGITVVAVPAAHAAVPAAGPSPPRPALTTAAPASGAPVIDPGWGRTPPAGSPLGTSTSGTSTSGTSTSGSATTATPGVGSASAEVTGPPPPAVGADRSTREIVVRRGDSLWRLARAALPPDATPREIASTWPRWYAANRAVIGTDPDHLEPGQHLTAPAVTPRAAPSFVPPVDPPVDPPAEPPAQPPIESPVESRSPR